MKILVINLGGNNRCGGVPGLRNTGGCVCSDERRRRAAEHSAVPFPSLDDCRELSGGDLSEPPVLIGCISGARAGTPGTLDGLDQASGVRSRGRRKARYSYRRAFLKTPGDEPSNGDHLAQPLRRLENV